MAAIGDNGIREDSVSGRMAAPGTDEAADQEIVYLQMSVNEFDQGPFIVGMNAHTPPEATDRAGF